MTINMNDKIKVKLTQKGVNILKNKHEESRKLCPILSEFELKLDKNGYYEDTLWHLFRDFGEYIMMGCDFPFETNITICK